MLIEIEDRTLVEERDIVLRFCAGYTRDVDVAEDLAQQTLLKAWQNEHQLKDPGARRGWLIGIARNTCAMWARGHARDLARRAHADACGPDGLDRVLVDDVDLEVELDRGELAQLLDRALALLPAETRDVLIHRYIQESPQAEIAARLGLTEGAVEARLHRGKLGLKRVLATQLSADAVSFGLLDGNDAGWEQTRLWCPGCAHHKLEGDFRPEDGILRLRCPECSTPDSYYVNSDMGNTLQGLSSYRPAVTRVLNSIERLFRVLPTGGALTCWRCGRRLPIVRHAVPPLSGAYQPLDALIVQCDTCGWHDRETWHSLTWSVPQVRQFWKDHPRMRYVPERVIDLDGREGIVSGFESAVANDRIEVVLVRDTGEVVSVNGTGPVRKA